LIAPDFSRTSTIGASPIVVVLKSPWLGISHASAA